jgi:hypothetical protein
MNFITNDSVLALKIRYYSSLLRNNSLVKVAHVLLIVSVIFITLLLYLFVFGGMSKIGEKVEQAFYQVIIAATQNPEKRKLLHDAYKTSTRFTVLPIVNQMTISDRRNWYDEIYQKCRAVNIPDWKIPRFY